MKFGKVSDIDLLQLTLPQDHRDTLVVLKSNTPQPHTPKVFTGFAQWNRNYLKSFYPKGIGKRDLEYYSTQVNCIEMNAFFYRIFPPEMVERWHHRSADGFTFCPKIPQTISQFSRLKNCEDKTTKFLESIYQFKEKLGTVFLQMHPNFAPDSFQDLKHFMASWPNDVPLTIELRHPDWYADLTVAEELYTQLEKYAIGHTITDTAGRRDLLHMRLTNPTCFIRFTGTNDKSDLLRINAWVERLTHWSQQGLDKIYFFIHQNDGHKNIDLYRYFVNQLNRSIGCSLTIPEQQDIT